ncbi:MULTISPECIES: hypothetical protein [Serratia]|uniref:hypothetical protein n=1 Tax=Serratia TaxID=613 RepID=UPI001CDCA350|nr:hypothetical protein [Serratia marcescens]MCA3995265.1 hypothetical protein [Serratia marcescens]
MKTLVILCLTLLVLSAFIQFIGYRRHKKEFDAFYQRYAGSGHFIPPYVAFADCLGMPGTSLKAQWFRWILNNRKLKLTRNVWLSPKTYDFVRTASSPRLQSWIRNDFRLLMLQGALLIIMCLLSYLLKSV